jgi:hypothetical protein
MANQEHLDILKQGVGAWNLWRKEHPDIQPDLRDANLYKANLAGVDFNDTNLKRANFNKVILTRATLIKASLNFANLSDGNLKAATSRKADLSDATLHRADLSDADLSEARLLFADLSDAILYNVDFRGASTLKTVFGNLDLRQVIGLDAVKHRGPSIIGIDTIYRSRGLIPEIFLRRSGVPDSFLEVIPSIVNRPIEYYTCFISYSSQDQAFAERLYTHLQNKGVRCWFAPHDMRTGDKIRERIDETIRLYDKLLLILSEYAVASSWVETEVETALEKERQMQERGSVQTVLFPLRLDNTVLQMTKPWAKEVRRRHITDFTGWKQHDAYQQAFHRLIRDLKASAASNGEEEPHGQPGAR